MFDFLKRLFKSGNRSEEEEPTLEKCGGSLAEIPFKSLNDVENVATKLCIMGKGSKVRYEPGGLYSAQCLWWVSEETDENGQPVYIRESEEHTGKVPAAGSFSAAGKRYRNLGQLSPNDVSDGIDADVYGRHVLCYRERFPCFDSFDYLHEHRYYRWYFLRENGKLTRIYTEDESGWLHITEDVEYVENKCVELLKRHDWVK